MDIGSLAKLIPNNIKKCFSKTGFTYDSEDEDNIPLAQLFPAIKDPIINLKQFAMIDSDVVRESAKSTISAYSEEIRETSETICDSENENEEAESISFSNPLEACKYLIDLENFFINVKQFRQTY